MALKKQAEKPEAELKAIVAPVKGKDKTVPAPVKKAAQPVVKKDNKLVRYFKEVRAELRKVVWPTRQTTLRLTGIVVGVTVAMSVFLGLLDLVFSKLFGLIIGA